MGRQPGAVGAVGANKRNGAARRRFSSYLEGPPEGGPDESLEILSQAQEQAATPGIRDRRIVPLREVVTTRRIVVHHVDDAEGEGQGARLAQNQRKLYCRSSVVQEEIFSSITVFGGFAPLLNAMAPRFLYEDV